MKKFLVFLFAISLVFGVVGMANAITVNFDEVILPTLTSLDGTTYYDPYGISFADQTFYAVDTRFAEDDYGITTTEGTNNFMSVLFDVSTPFVNFAWVTITSNNINAFAYDELNNLVDTFSVTGLSGTSTGTGSLSNGSIKKVTFSDGTGKMGIDSLTYESVPEPATMLLLGSGLIGLAVFGRKRLFKKS